jgi:hypothetical protein
LTLLGNDTVWAFVSGSDEDRFLDDISFGIQCLLHRNFSLSNILLFIDQPRGPMFVSAYGFPSELTPYTTSQLTQVLSSKCPKKLVILVTGHGNYTGISALPDIQPYSLLSLVKSLSGLENALLVLGQCFAGTFNFLEARSLDPKTGKIVPPEVCIIGATDLNVSVSLQITIPDHPVLSQFNCNKQWSANLFLFFFMLHVAIPSDVDGDGKHTIIDIYKAAGILTNQQLLNVKQSAFMNIFQEILTSTVTQLIQTPIAQELSQKARSDLIAAFDTILINQNPWILHANLARQLEL